MADGTSNSTTNSLVNLGDLSKPADTLIKKISKLVGGIFAPGQMKRMAKAEAEVAILKAETEIQITALHRRAMHRFVEEEAQRQQNIEDITEKAIPQLKDSAAPDSIEDDWVTNFFEKSRIVSNKEMQELWSRVLAGEANTPGTYSKRTVNLLSDLDKKDAQLFEKLLGFAWMSPNVSPLVFDPQAAIYNQHGIDFDSLTHLGSIGLLRFDPVAGFAKKALGGKCAVFYYGRPVILEFKEEADTRLRTGTVLLSQAGKELVQVCASKPVDGFLDYVMEQWKEYKPQLLPKQNAAASEDSEGR